MSCLKEFYLQRIREADSLNQLDYIVEEASNKIKSNTDYHEIYEAALRKAQSWQPI